MSSNTTDNQSDNELSGRLDSLTIETIPKKFVVNGAIRSDQQNSICYVDPNELNADLLKSIRNGNYLLFHGARASGKTTSILRAIEQLKNEFCCI